MFTRCTLSIGLAFSLLNCSSATSQDSRGRKYKAPPETSHIEVLVLKDTNKKPVTNAAVVFHSVRDGKDEGNLEVKTNAEGKAVIDVIPTGSSVDVQVIADGFATFADTYQVNEPNRAIEIHMIKPRAQISTYVDTRGQASQRTIGVQEPARPTTPSVVQTTKSPANDTSDPSRDTPGAMNYTPPARTSPAQPSTTLQTNPPNMHPDNQYPVDPATAPKLPPSQTPPTAPPPQL
jgi:hypothetical protein